VVNPAPDRAGLPRYSLPFFQHFASDYVIDVLPGCVTPENPSRYPLAITADGYLRERLSEIKLKV
jgi:isopenicillin N synthase-like dioxygenase